MGGKGKVMVRGRAMVMVREGDGKVMVRGVEVRGEGDGR